MATVTPRPQPQPAYAQYLPGGTVTRRRLVDPPIRYREVTEEELEEIIEAFQVFDHEKTGEIDYREFKVAMRSLGFPAKKKDVLAVLDEYNKDQHSMITEAEFRDIMLRLVAERAEGEKFLKAFQLFDDDGTNFITLKNLRRIAQDMGDTIPPDELEAMIYEFDKDGDGQISLEEFFSIMNLGES